MICWQGNDGEVAKVPHDMDTAQTNTGGSVPPIGLLENLNPCTTQDPTCKRTVSNIDDDEGLGRIC
jgi:hypothetical protein